VKHPIQRLYSSRRTTLSRSIPRLAGGALLLAGAFASSSAMAQDQGATNLDRSRSPVPYSPHQYRNPVPVQVVTRQEIDRSGKTTVAEYLQTLTSDGAGSIPKTFGNGFAGGGAGISLRGLGAGSTLVLLNGRRMATYGLADDGQRSSPT
jgi:iron complex outermembrane receptor protein